MKLAFAPHPGLEHAALFVAISVANPLLIAVVSLSTHPVANWHDWVGSVLTAAAVSGASALLTLEADARFTPGNPVLDLPPSPVPAAGPPVVSPPVVEPVVLIDGVPINRTVTGVGGPSTVQFLTSTPPVPPVVESVVPAAPEEEPITSTVGVLANIPTQTPQTLESAATDTVAPPVAADPTTTTVTHNVSVLVDGVPTNQTVTGVGVPSTVQFVTSTPPAPPVVEPVVEPVVPAAPEKVEPPTVAADPTTTAAGAA